MAITSLPIPPSRSDPENFPERADSFMAALPRFATEANELQEHVNETAATVDQDATATALSREAAAESRSQAGQAAQAAETARQAAAQKAGEAGASAQLARAWASKADGPVDGSEFSAKHYALLAAAGMGLPIYYPENIPTANIGPIYISMQGPAEWNPATGKYSVVNKLPVGTPVWWPLRSSIPAGQFPQDGQTIPRALCPDLTAMVIAGTLPVVAEATWQSDPTQRGKYTLGDGSTTIRLPDFNGKSAGSLGAVFQRGDGALSAATGGLIQRDAFQNITGSIISTYATSVRAGAAGAFVGSNGGSQGSISSWQGTASPQPGDLLSFNAANSPGARTATETRALNVTGVWTVHAFGTVVNPGSVDAAQLASDYAVLNASVQTLQGQILQTFGVGQQWFAYDTSERAGGTYVNSTPQPILVRFVGTANAAGNLGMILDGDTYSRIFWDSTNVGAQIGNAMLVPAGSNYSIIGASFTRVAWREYRKTR